VTIRKKIRKAISPDSYEILPSQRGRITNLRNASPAMLTATRAAKKAANQ